MRTQYSRQYTTIYRRFLYFLAFVVENLLKYYLGISKHVKVFSLQETKT
jgi:hypothetical protein